MHHLPLAVLLAVLVVGAAGADAVPSAADVRFALEQANDPVQTIDAVELTTRCIGAAGAAGAQDRAVRALLAADVVETLREELADAIAELRRDPTAGGPQRGLLLRRATRLRELLKVVRILGSKSDDPAAYAGVLARYRGEFFFDVRSAEAADVDAARTVLQRVLAWIDDPARDLAVLPELFEFGDADVAARAMDPGVGFAAIVAGRRVHVAGAAAAPLEDWSMCDGEYLAVRIDAVVPDADDGILHRTDGRWRLLVKTSPASHPATTRTGPAGDDAPSGEP